MLSRIRLERFQMHDSLELQLDQLTVLWGETGAGKSTVVRALNWIGVSGPGGGFVARGKSDCLATLEADGAEVSRGKTKSKHFYKLNGSEFGAVVRQGIPQEITNLLKVSDLNFGLQFAPPFLLSCSPADASRVLNRTVSLDLIDSVLSTLESGVRQAEQADRMAQERLTAAQDRADKLTWVDKAQEILSEIELAQAERDGVASVVMQATSTARSWRLLLESAQNAEGRATDARMIADKALRRVELAEKIKQAKLIRKTLSNKPPIPPKGLADKLTKAGALRGEIQRANYYLTALRQAQEEVCRSARRAGKAAEELAAMTAGRCPLCGKSQGKPSS